MNTERAYRRGVRHSFGGMLAVSVLQFFQMLVFARWAGPAAVGDYALAAAVMGFVAPLAEAGISQAVVQHREVQPGQLATLALVGFVLGAGLLVVLYFLGGPLGAWYGRSELAGLLPLMALPLLFTPFSAAQGGLFLRDFRFDLAVKIEVGASLLGFVLLFIFLAAGYGVFAMAWSFVGRNTGSALACWWLARKAYPVDWRHPARWRSVWPMLRFGGLDLSARWADYLANYLDKLIVGKWLGAEALGFYQLAFSLLVLPTARLGYALTRVSYPVFSRLRHAPRALQAFFQRNALDLLLLLFPVYLALGLFAEALIGVMYGARWLAAVPLVQAFAVAGFVRSMSGVFPQLAKGIGRPDLLTVWLGLWAVGAAVFLIVFLWIEPTAAAAAWSRVAAKFILEIPLLFLLARWCGVDFGLVFRTGAGLALACMGLALAVILADWAVAPFDWGFCVKILVWLAGLAVMAVFSPWNKALRRLFRTIAQSRFIQLKA